MATGANENDWHYKGVDIARDIRTTAFVDLREVKTGRPAPGMGARSNCGRELRLVISSNLGPYIQKRLAHMFRMKMVSAIRSSWALTGLVLNVA